MLYALQTYLTPINSRRSVYYLNLMVRNVKSLHWEVAGWGVLMKIWLQSPCSALLHTEWGRSRIRISGDTLRYLNETFGDNRGFESRKD